MSYITNEQSNQISECIKSNINSLNILEFISLHLNPENVFNEKSLKLCANENGYYKKMKNNVSS